MRKSYVWRKILSSLFPIFSQKQLEGTTMWGESTSLDYQSLTIKVSGEFLPNHPPSADFCKKEGGGDLEVTQISYRKKNVKIFPLRGKEGGWFRREGWFGRNSPDITKLKSKKFWYFLLFRRKSVDFAAAAMSMGKKYFLYHF